MAYQPFIYTALNVGWGATSTIVGVSNGALTATTPGTFGIYTVRIPMPCGGVWKNLAAFTNDSGAGSFTVGLVVNETLSGLTCGIPSGGGTGFNVDTEVTVVEGDIVYMQVYDGPNLGATGIVVSFYIEFEGEDGKQIFSIPAMHSNTIGGAFGAGIAQSTVLTQSNTLTYCPTPGTITRLYAKVTEDFIASGKAFEVVIIRNGVDEASTIVTLDESNEVNFTDFSLHCDYLDIVEIRSYMTSGGPLPACAFGVSITWIPDDPTLIMFCGGNNISVGDFNWISGIQNGDVENDQRALIGGRGFTLAAAWVIRGGPVLPSDEGGVHTLRLNGGDTDIAIDIFGATKQADDTGSALYVSGDYIDWGMVYTSGASLGQMHWSVVGVMVVPPPPVGGIYKVVPWSRKPEDTIWVNVDSEETFDVKIPDPTFRLPLLGD